MKKGSTLLFISVISIALLASCNSSTDKSDPDKGVTTKKKDSTPTGTNANDVKVQELKSATTVANNLINNVEQNKRRKDSIRMANATHTWVYQIGLPFEKDDLAGVESDKLKNLSNVYIFKKSRHEYYLIKDDGYPKELLEDSLGDFKKKLQGIETRVTIIDIASLCSNNKKPEVSGSIKYKVDGDKKKIECRECE